jgi:hypothetical protein
MCTVVRQYLVGSQQRAQRDMGGSCGGGGGEVAVNGLQAVDDVNQERARAGTTYESADGVSDALPSRTSFRNSDISWGGGPGAGPALDWSASPPFCGARVGPAHTGHQCHSHASATTPREQHCAHATPDDLQREAAITTGGRTICWAAEDEMRLWGGEEDAIVIDAGLTDGGKLSSSE